MSREQLALISLVPPGPPPGAPIVECVFTRRRRLDVSVKAVSGTDTDGQAVVPGTWCRFPPGKRHVGARFAVGGLTRIVRKRGFYYATRQPLWLLSPGGTTR